ncbi:MAG: DMT family transporter [Acidimicrobiia bacterium]|nr:DMT family transporter [Acidimicrobiia bacterium]
MVQAVRRAFVGEGSLSYRQGAAIVLFGGLMFSFTPLIFRGLEEATDWQFLVLRSGAMVAVLLLVVLLRRGKRPVRFDNVTWRTWLAAILMASMSALFILALARTTAALVTFLLAAAPFFGALFGWIVMRERVSGPSVGAIAMAVVGVAVMVGSGIEAGDALGVLLAALIPLLLGLYNVLIRSAGEELDPLVPSVLAGIVLVAAATSVALTQTGISFTTRDLMLGLLAGAVVMGVGLPLFNLGHRYVPTAQVSLLNLTEIVLAPLWVWLWLGETPRTGTLFGGAIVLAAVVYLVLASDRALRLAAR